MGFLLRENSYLLKCYPTIKVFCGLAVKQRGPEVEITGFSFWLRHKFPLSELWASPFITACVTLAVPLLGYLVGAGCATQGNSCHPCDVREVSQTWHSCCACAGGAGTASDVKISLCKLPGKCFSSAPHQACESLSCGVSWAVLMVQMQPEIFLSSSSPLRVKIQALT